MQPIEKALSPKLEKQVFNISQKQSVVDSQMLYCRKHNSNNVQLICTVKGCNQNRFICDVCKVKQSVHISYHSPYIYKPKQFFQFSSHHDKNVLSRFQKGVQDLQQHIRRHKQFYQTQLKHINADFDLVISNFTKKVTQYRKIYVQNFQKQIQLFDSDVVSIISALKSYANQKSSQDSFFSKFFSSNSHKVSKLAEVEEIVNKNQKGFEVRASILNLKSKLAARKGNKIQYKPTQNQDHVFSELLGTLDDFCNHFFNNIQNLLVSNSHNSPQKKKRTPEQSQNANNLRSSIMLQTQQIYKFEQKQAGKKWHHNAQNLNLPEKITSNDTIPRKLGQSNVSISLSEGGPDSGSNIIKLQELPQINPKVKEILQYLKPLPQFNAESKQYQESQKYKDQNIYRYEAGVYKGSYSPDGLREGRGVFIFTDGSYYEGHWHKDKMSGYGRLVKPTSYYQGEIKQGLANGRGNFQDIEKTYSGQWSNDLRHGYGEQQFKNLDKHYAGNFLNDKYQGRGKLTLQDAVYEGQFHCGLFQGEGIVRYRNGQLFKGSFKQNFKIVGRHSFPDGSYYQGNFQDNMPHGQGKFYWPDGIRYFGQWKKGLQDGIGLETLVNGKEMKGMWQKGLWIRWL